ncbi:MAG: serine/threonine-protein kinase [Myxococcota bacterium]
MNSVAELRPDELEGHRFGVYRLDRLIGTGGFASVYEGRHLHLKKPVAIKILRSEYATDLEYRTHFLREGEAAGRIRHPHVVDITDVGVTEAGLPYLVMELLQGEDLEVMLRRKSILDERMASEIIVPCIAAVRAAHKAGVLHRDIKPANIFLTQNANGIHPKVLDFGISEVLGTGSDEQAAHVMLGTPWYMSPERVLTGTAGEPGDQYALGVVLYEMVTGSVPFDGSSVEDVLAQIKRGQFVMPRVLRPNLDPEFESIILRAIDSDPTQRFQSLDGLGLTLLPFMRRKMQVYWEAEFGIRHSALDLLSFASKELPADTASAPKPRASLATTPIHGLSDAELRDAMSHSARVRRSDVPVPGPVDQNEVDTEPPEGQARTFRRTPTLTRTALATLFVSILFGSFGLLLLGRNFDQRQQFDQRQEQSPSERKSFTVRVKAEPAHVTMELDGLTAGKGSSLVRTLPVDGRAHTLTVSAEGYDTQQFTFVNYPPPSEVRLVKTEQPMEVQGGNTQVRSDAAAQIPDRSFVGRRRRNLRRSSRAAAPAKPTTDAPVEATGSAGRSEVFPAGSSEARQPQVTANGAPILD